MSASQAMASTPARAPLLPLDVATAQLLATVKALTEVEQLATLEADGRVLAEDIVSALHVPPQDNSSMDGYAVRSADLAQPPRVLAVSQRIAAGSVGQPLQPHTAARIFTGAPLPPGADAVVMQEDCTVLPQDQEPGYPVGGAAGFAAGGAAGIAAEAAAQALPAIQINTTVQPGQWVRRAGEDVSRGAVVLSRGQRLGPAELGLAASIGMATLPVLRRPRVALFSTGDELVMPGTVAPEHMPPGAIYNSNRFFLNPLLRRMGCAVTDFGIVPDQRQATIAALQTAAASHDLILTSGGVSVGEEDHIKPAVQSLGHLDLWQIAIKPGKPFAHGRAGAAHFIGLPGNPVSSFVTFLLLVRPFLLRLQGVADVALPTQHLVAHFDWPRPDKRQEFLRVRRNARGGLDLFPNQSSGVLTSAVWGDGLADIPAGQAVRAGETVRFVPFAELLS